MVFTVHKSERLLEKDLHRLVVVKTGPKNPPRRFWLVGIPKTSIPGNRKVGTGVGHCVLWEYSLWKKFDFFSLGFPSFWAYDALKKVNLRSVQF